MSKTHETLHHKTHKQKDDGIEEKEVVKEEKEPAAKSESSFIRVSSLFDNEWHHGVIEVFANQIGDFFSEKEKKVKTDIQFAGFPPIEFKKLAYQKKEKNFNFMPHYSDGLISAEELKEYL